MKRYFYLFKWHYLRLENWAINLKFLGGIVKVFRVIRRLPKKKKVILPLNSEQIDIWMPEEEKKFLIEKQDKASVIFEYGSGGSTLSALNKGKTIFSVETDQEWIQKIISESPQFSEGTFYPLYVDVGSTKELGYPANEAKKDRWFNYALSPWRDAFKRGLHPDLVLIDGRFRVASFVASVVFCRKDMIVLWDDYSERVNYHHIEKTFKPEAIIGRMAVFKVKPGNYTQFLLENFNYFFNPD